MREAENHLPLRDEPIQLECIMYIGGEWFFADDIDADVDKGACNRKVAVIRRHNHHHVNTIRADSFSVRHVLETRIDSVVRDPQHFAGLP